MNDEPTPLIDYGEAVDAAMLKLFGIDTSDAGIDADLIASAQEEGPDPGRFRAVVRRQIRPHLS